MRYLAALVLTLLVNLALFWLMQHVLLTDKALPKPAPVTQLKLIDASALGTAKEMAQASSPPPTAAPPMLVETPVQPPSPSTNLDLPDLALPKLEQPKLSLPQPQIGQAAKPKPAPKPKPKPPAKPTPKPKTVPKLVASKQPATTANPANPAGASSASANAVANNGKATQAQPQRLPNGRVLADRDLQPIVRSEPRYPRLAKQHQQEGKVVVEFVIGKDGRVSEPKVIYSQPPGVFERASLQAISRWRYKPRLIQGQPVEQLAQQTLVFRLR